MQQASEWAHSSTAAPGTTGARAVATAAASNPTMAGLVGVLVDFIIALRRGHPDAAGPAPVLVRLAADGPMRACDLAERLHLDQSTVSRHVSALEGEGLVMREPHDLDRRAHLLALTPDGAKAATSAVTTRVHRYESAVADWPEDDVAELTRLLNQFVAGLDALERTST